MLLSFFVSLLALGVGAHADHSAVAPSRKLDIGTFASVGQELFGIPSANEEDVLFGTTVVLSSLDGSRLAIGAPMHDYGTAEANELSVNDNGGAIFLYEYDGSAWNQIWFLAGDAGEGLGERFSLSADGSRIAVRRESSNPDSVEVYDIGAGGEATAMQAGETVSCGANGDTVTLSADGTRLAVSCENFRDPVLGANTGRVEVFDWTGTTWSTTGTIDGSAGGDFFGWSTAFSNDGNRIAISAPNHDSGGATNRGQVRVFDYVSEGWSQIGADILGDNTADQQGFSMDLSGDGLSLVASCPGGSNGEVALTGLVKVFVESGGIWSQVGDAIAGGDTNDRFGRSVSIADNGSRLAASSYIHDGSRGHLRLFDLTGDSWVQFGSDIDGENSADRFGNGIFSVTLTGDGSRVASGSTLYGDAGRVRVFDSAELVSTDSPTIEPTTAPSVAPIVGSTFGPTTTPSVGPSAAATVEPTAEESQAPSGGPTEAATTGPTVEESSGLAPAPTDGPTAASQTLVPTADTTSGTPTGAPSSSPSLSHAPSPSPTMSAAPSVAETTAPSSLLGKTDWDIDRVGDITVNFTEVATEEEIKITFSIHRRGATVRIFQEDCRTAVDESVIGLQTTRVPVTGTKDTLEVFLDIKQDSVSESPIFSAIDTETGKISICVRVDLLSVTDMSSVAFYDQQLFFTVDMSAEFAVTDIDLVRGFDSVDVGASFDYTVTACQCNESFECEPQILTQASDALICIETNTTNVEIVSIRQLFFNQGSLAQTAIGDGTEDELTIVNVSGKKAVVRTKLFAAFFELDFPENIEATGVCTLKFVDDNGQVRRLNTPVSTARILQQAGGVQPEEVGFAVELFLEAGAESSGCDKIATTAYFMMAAMVYGVAMLM